MERYGIVGFGCAGYHGAKSLRANGYTGVIDDVCPRCGRHEGEGVPVEKLDELRKRYPGVPHFAGKT